MSELFQKTNIGSQEYKFSHNARDNSYAFIVDSDQFKFKRWTWGEKNRISNECVTFNPATSQFEVNTVAFNEKMLAETLIEIDIDGKKLNPTLDTIRDYKATLGDQLLMISQWVNSIESNENEDSSAEVSAMTAGDSTYEVHLNGDVFKIRMWTWGEKNRATSQSIEFDSASGQLKVDLRTFNEMLLLASIDEVRINGKPIELDMNFLRNLDAQIGDRLLQAAQKVNNISETEKKTSEMP